MYVPNINNIYTNNWMIVMSWMTEVAVQSRKLLSRRLMDSHYRVNKTIQLVLTWTNWKLLHTFPPHFEHSVEYYPPV
jgi:hypothetical protein